MAIKSINPANGHLLRRYTPLAKESISEKLALAADAFIAYASVPIDHCALCMRKLTSILEHETEDLAGNVGVLKHSSNVHSAL